MRLIAQLKREELTRLRALDLFYAGQFIDSAVTYGMVSYGGLVDGGDALDGLTYRVSVSPHGVNVICFGIESVDSTLEGHYDRIDDLPNWVKERLAILNMMSSTPPTEEVEGVGRRISEDVYWVFAPTDKASMSA